jgi:hypothetical protein
MHICPRGHDSVAADYCDECGTPIGAPAAPIPKAPILAATVEIAADAVNTDPCPDCGTARSGRFCEVCGWDFLAETPPNQSPPPLNQSPPPPNESPPLTAAAPSRASRPGALRVIVSADRAYHTRMAATAAPDAETVAFPLFCPDRRFALDGGQLLIGRRSRSRGIEPDIDLTGPPEDAGVSHAHALLVSTSDGGWSVVDLDSANGTYLNDDTDPIEPNVPVPVKNSDRIHIGAWTTLTLLA